ncbi:MAG: class II histone deacetylase, partial [Acidimicrobiia bacterium]|nr:class II histone deacetylase [Acidimicrobiia bacterium]
MLMVTGLVWHERFLFHNPTLRYGSRFEPEVHFEHPSTKRRIYTLLMASGLGDHLQSITARPATRTELERFHTPEYLDRIEELSRAGGGVAGEAAPFGPGSFEVAALAVGGCIEAVEAVVTGRVTNAYALVRPPGHHAERDQGRGFCLLANAALAIMSARAVHGVGKVAVIDWDVHHGNGTEQAFYDDPDVLTISIHQDRNYPIDTGASGDRGSGSGVGANVNIP